MRHQVEAVANTLPNSFSRRCCAVPNCTFQFENKRTAFDRIGFFVVRVFELHPVVLGCDFALRLCPHYGFMIVLTVQMGKAEITFVEGEIAE